MGSQSIQDIDWDHDPDDATKATSPSSHRRPIKRARVAVACQRCKCDGQTPCSNCDAFAAHCHYQPSKFRANNFNQQQSFKAMQARLAELEAIVEKNGYEARASPNEPSSIDEESVARTPMAFPIVNAEDNQRGSSQNPLLLMLRDLSIGAMGEYMGATSQVTMSRLIGSMARKREGSTAGDPGSDVVCGSEGTSGGWEHLSPKSASTGSKLQSADRMEVGLADMPVNIANKLFRGYIHHISTRWPVMHSPYITQLHETRGNLTDVYEVTALHLVYAIGGRFLETSGETGDFYSESHCEIALESLEEIIQRHAGLRSIQILILLALYNLRSPKGPGAWTYAGMAMRQCIDLGLHRQTRTKWPLIEEMRRRVFWTCYCLDRQVSIILGRPFAISDRDIDAELPTDVDEDVEDLDLLARLQKAEWERKEACPAAVSTSMTGFIYICRLRMIESDIQQTIYRVDKASPSSIKAEVEGFITRLEEWRSQMPLDAQELPDFDTMRVDGYDNYMVYYYKCLRFLLFPVILSSEVANTSFLTKCAEACAGVCRTYKKLHQKVPVGFSVMALHSIFTAGLTLLYCTWAAPRDVFSVGTSNGLDACGIVMYVIAERWTGARKYRDVFDVVKQAVLETIETDGEEPRRPIADLRQSVIAALKTAGRGAGEVCRGDFSAMVNDMTGDEGQIDLGGDECDEGGTIVVGSGDAIPRTRYEGDDGSVGAGVLDFGLIMPFETMPLNMDLDLMGQDLTVGLSPGRWGGGMPYERFSQ